VLLNKGPSQSHELIKLPNISILCALVVFTRRCSPRQTLSNRFALETLTRHAQVVIICENAQTKDSPQKSASAAVRLLHWNWAGAIRDLCVVVMVHKTCDLTSCNTQTRTRALIQGLAMSGCCAWNRPTLCRIDNGGTCTRRETQFPAAPRLALAAGSRKRGSRHRLTVAHARGEMLSRWC